MSDTVLVKLFIPEQIVVVEVKKRDLNTPSYKHNAIEYDLGQVIEYDILDEDYKMSKEVEGWNILTVKVNNT